MHCRERAPCGIVETDRTASVGPTRAKRRTLAPAQCAARRARAIAPLRGDAAMSAMLEAKALSGLQALGLGVAAEQLDSVAQQAAANAWSYSQFLGTLLDGELRTRLQKRI